MIYTKLNLKKKLKMKTKRKLMLLTLIIAHFMIFLDSSILPVALPTIQRLFHSSMEQLQWMINSYLLAIAILAALSGKISDIFGHRKIFLLSLVVFGFFSFLCAISQDNLQLIISRFCQGIGAALMVSSALPLIVECFEEKIRGKIIGIIVSAASLGFTMGPLVGGFFSQYLSWHYIFLINIPIAIIGVIVGFISIPKSIKLNEKIDFKGAISFIIAVSCLTIALMQGKTFGWGSLTTILLFFFFVCFALILYFSDKKAKHPFIDFSIFKNVTFLCALIALCTISIARIMAMYWVIYFQNVLEFTPTYAGILEMISAIPMLFFSAYVGKFCDKYGSRRSIITGQIVTILSFLLLIFCLPRGNIILLSISLLFFGVGVVFIKIASFSSGLSSVSSNKRGIAGGLLNSFNNLGSSFGVAVLGAVFLNSQFKFFTSNLKKNPDTQNIDPNVFEGLLSKTTKALNALKTLPSSIQAEIKTAMKTSYSYGINLSNLIAAFIIALALFVIFYLFKPKKKKEKIPYKKKPKDQV
ncbi:MAG: Multidrug resistance protein Stp [Candidatus Anoxychlamydiales bacterium]|nr:Multidrug resistance protein Stp [Candidatus Anoxychlamydiales bacterium]